MKHQERAHSKFSASGAERRFNCPGSVALSEGIPDKQTEWSREGTQAHEVLEETLKYSITPPKNKFTARNIARVNSSITQFRPKTMVIHAVHAANFILNLYTKLQDSEILIENKVHLTFIHPEMFGTYDGAVVDHFGTLHVFDYKYGAGHAVSPKENLQMIFYGIGLANLYDWNFKRVRLWIIQPRIKGYDGPVFWELTIPELKRYVEDFKKAVERVEVKPFDFQEGSWCHWCRAKTKCPLKEKTKLEHAKMIFK